MKITAMLNTTIAHYKVTAKLGQGGMGEVYRATDTKLGREVAIKVLPEEFASNKERLARFEREAKALAQLNHPHIATVHGFDQSHGQWFLAMELVEGEDLSERLKRGALPVGEALEVCKQIAEALEAAHEKGIIHRDLKPGNVQLTEDGQVKVLDFGLAKAAETEQGRASSQALSAQSAEGDGSRERSPLLDESPTITADYTMPGTLLGTAAYMSPEQARGRPVDKRSDIWSFGCVLYECLTGKRLFQGEDTTETLAIIIKEEPDWLTLPEGTPGIVQLLLRKCLAKDRRRRLRDIGDAVMDLEQAISDPDSSFVQLGDRALEQSVGDRWRSRKSFAGALVSVALLVASLVWFLKPEREPIREKPPARKISMELGMDGELVLGHGLAFELSPDSTTLCFIARMDEMPTTPQLFLRRLDELDAKPIDGTEFADQFCFSPDGKWIVFRDGKESRLKKISLSDGIVVPLCPSFASFGIDWGDDGWIVFAEKSGGIWRIAAAGGKREPLTNIPENSDAKSHRWPLTLPGGQALIYSSHTAMLGWSSASLMVQRLPGSIAEPIGLEGYGIRFLKTGHLIFHSAGTLYKVAFDLDALKIQGDSIPLIQGVYDKSDSGPQFDVSPGGALVYFRNKEAGEQLSTVEWLDREGERQMLLPSGIYSTYRFSFDGNSLAYFTWDRQVNIWIYDLERSVPRKLTRSPEPEIFPVWHPNGKSIAFANMRNGPPNLSWRKVDGSGEVQHWTNGTTVRFPLDWSPSGENILIYEESVEGGGDLRIVSVEGDEDSGWRLGSSEDFLGSKYSEVDGRISTDGNWVAYCSDESGLTQIYVCRFPGGGNKTQITFGDFISVGPRWSRKSNELVYRRAVEGAPGSGTAIFSVKYAIKGESFLVDRPLPWKGAPRVLECEIHPDGERLLIRVPDESATQSKSDHVILIDQLDE